MHYCLIRFAANFFQFPDKVMAVKIDAHHADEMLRTLTFRLILRHCVNTIRET